METRLGWGTAEVSSLDPWCRQKEGTKENWVLGVA